MIILRKRPLSRRKKKVIKVNENIAIASDTTDDAMLVNAEIKSPLIKLLNMFSMTLIISITGVVKKPFM